MRISLLSKILVLESVFVFLSELVQFGSSIIRSLTMYLQILPTAHPIGSSISVAYLSLQRLIINMLYIPHYSICF